MITYSPKLVLATPKVPEVIYVAGDQAMAFRVQDIPTETLRKLADQWKADLLMKGSKKHESRRS